MKYFGYIVILLSSSAFAELGKIIDNTHGLPGSGIVSGGNESGVTSFFSKVIQMLQDVTAIAALLGVVLVGILYITSQGNEEKTEKAKNYMMSILFGVVLAFTAWSIISLIDLIPNSLFR